MPVMLVARATKPASALVAVLALVKVIVVTPRKPVPVRVRRWLATPLLAERAVRIASGRSSW
jgi:hypothetical protein